MYSWSVCLFTIEVFFHFIPISTNAYEVIGRIRAPVRGIPIRPLDFTTIRRLAYKPAPINPDAEPIFLPLHSEKYKPFQIMERISATPTAKATVNRKYNANQEQRNKDNFNFLNFDAYLVKPNAAIALKPDTDRILRLMNYTEHEYQDEPTSSSSSHHKLRSQKPSKKSKKKNHSQQLNEFSDFDFYKAYQEHQMQAAAMKKLKKHLSGQQQPRNANKYAHSSAKLPIGIEFFEQRHKNKMPFPPITYSPLYLNNLHRKHNFEDVEASNIHINTQRLEMLQNEEFPTTTVAPPTAIVAQDMNEAQANTISPAEEVHLPEEAKTYHNLVTAPEVYKFTLDDAVIRPPRSNAPPAMGPVTFAPPPSTMRTLTNEEYVLPENMPHVDVVVDSNGHNTHGPYTIKPQVQYYHPHTNMGYHVSHPNKHVSHYQVYEKRIPHEQTEYRIPNIGYRRIERIRYNQIPMELSRHQLQQHPSNQVVMSTQMVVTTNEPKINKENEVTTLQPIEVADPKRMDSPKNYKKRRMQINVSPLNQVASEDDSVSANSRKHRQKDSFFNNLEFSSSYSKQRTQGYNSGEEQSTTPISIKLKNVNSANNESTQLTTASPPRRSRVASPVKPKTENIKYFQ